MSTSPTQNIPNQLLSLIQTLLLELHPNRPLPTLSLESRLTRDLGLDSLALIELFGRVERQFSVTVPEQVLARVETVRDLLTAIESAAPSSPPSQPRDATPPRPESAPPGEEPLRAETLPEVLTHHARLHPDRPHIRFYTDSGSGEMITYGRLLGEAEKTATGLLTLGIQPGEPVPLMLGTEPDYFFTFFGILLAGGIPVPLYPPFRPSRIRDHLLRQKSILNNCAPSVMVAMADAKGAARLLKGQVESLKRIITPAELIPDSARVTTPPITAAQTALLQYTSGSTGIPKGVVLTHANLLANIRAMGSRVRASSSDVFVSWLPLYHDMGLIGAWLGSLYYGAELVIMSPLAFITRPVRWLRAIHEHRGTLSAAPNFAYSLCVHKIPEEDLTGLDLSSWRGAFNGAEPVSPDTTERFCARFQTYGFQPSGMMPVYGLAECSVGLAFPPVGRNMIIDRVSRGPLQRNGLARPAAPDDPAPLVFVSSGRPLTDTKYASRTAPDGKSRTGRRDVSSFAVHQPPRATSATRNRPRNSFRTAGSIPAIWPTRPKANCSSPAGARISSSGPGVTYTPRNSKRPWENSPPSARETWPCSAAQGPGAIQSRSSSWPRPGSSPLKNEKSSPRPSSAWRPIYSSFLRMTSSWPAPEPFPKHPAARSAGPPVGNCTTRADSCGRAALSGGRLPD